MNEQPSQNILDQHTGFLVNQKLKPKIQHMKVQSSLTETGDNFSKALNRSKYFQNTFQQPLLAEFKQGNIMEKSNGFMNNSQSNEKKKIIISKNRNHDTMPIQHYSYNNCLLFQPSEKPQSMTKEKRSIQVIKNNFQKREKIRALSAHQKKQQGKNRDLLNNSKILQTNQNNISAFNFNDNRSYFLENQDDDFLHENSVFPLNPIYTEPDQYQTFAINDEQNQIQQYNTLSLQGRSNISRSRQEIKRNYSSHSQVRSPMYQQELTFQQRETLNKFHQNRIFNLPEKEQQFEHTQTPSPYFEKWNSPSNKQQNQMQVNLHVDKDKIYKSNQGNNQFNHNQTYDSNQTANNNHQIQGLNSLNQTKNQTQEIDSQNPQLQQNNKYSQNGYQFEVSLGDLENSTMVDYYQQNKITSDQLQEYQQFQNQTQNNYGKNYYSEAKELQNSQQIRQKSNQKVIYYNVLPIQKQQIFDENQYQKILKAKNSYLKNNTSNTSGIQSKGKSPCNNASSIKPKHFNYVNPQVPTTQITQDSQIHDFSTDQMQENIQNINNQQQSSMSVRLDQLNLQQVDWGKVMKKEKPIHSNHELQKNQKQILRNINNQKFKFIRNASMIAQHQMKDANKQINDQQNANSNQNILELSSLSQNVNYAQSMFFFQTDSGFRPQTTSAAQKQRPTTPQILNQTTKSMHSNRKFRKEQSLSFHFQDKVNRMGSAKSTNPIQEFITKQGDEEYQELDILRNTSQLLDPNNAKDIINSSYNQSFYLQKTASSVNEGKLKSGTFRQAITPTRYQTTIKTESGQNFERPISVSSKRQQLKQKHQNIEKQINSLFKELGIRNKQQPSPIRLNTYA